MQSCAGQIILPDGYLQKVYKLVIFYSPILSAGAVIFYSPILSAGAVMVMIVW